jgi:hypothetical protein
VWFSKSKISCSETVDSSGRMTGRAASAHSCLP